jgi:hypothetical protein
MNPEDDFDKELKENLVFLLGYFVASVSHDHDEWDAWGLQYIKMCAESLGFDDAIVAKVNETFLGTIGHGFSFTFDEVEDGWTHVHHLSFFLEKLSRCLDKWDEETVIRYFLTTLADSISHGNYDARLRVLISHRICSMFNIPAQTIADLEGKAVHSTNIDKEFDTAPAMDIRGAVGSFRAWKVGFAAASGRINTCVILVYLPFVVVMGRRRSYVLFCWSNSPSYRLISGNSPWRKWNHKCYGH